MSMKLIASALIALLPTALPARNIVPQPPLTEPDWKTIRPELEEYIRSHLVDPDSAKIDWPRGFKWTSFKPPLMGTFWGWIGCASVNAKNRMGGYTGAKAIMMIWDNGIKFIDSDDNYMFSIVAERCAKLTLPAAQSAFYLNNSKAITLSIADELEKLSALRDRNVITAPDFEIAKQRLLAR